MTFVSFVEATHRLSIDAKTLHRWLADAQLALQNHPHDGRKKVVSLEHLQALARLHHRQLAFASQEVLSGVGFFKEGGKDLTKHRFLIR